MTPDSKPAATAPHFFYRIELFFQKEARRSLFTWALIALFNGLALILLRRELALGEFGTLNTGLAIVGLMTVPVLAVYEAFGAYLSLNHPEARKEKLDSLRAAAPLVIDTFAWAWGALSLVLIFIVLLFLGLPRFSVQLFILLNVLVAICGIMSAVMYRSANRLRLWGGLLVVSALLRMLLSAGFAWHEPWAESGLAALLLAGLISLGPVLRQTGTEHALRLKALLAAKDRDFLIYLGATFSTFLALFLFTNADRIVAQHWFGIASDATNIGIVEWDKFDAYQTAGLLGRSLLWGTQPLLWILFAQRSRVEKSTAASITFFWYYLGALLVGAVLLAQLDKVLAGLFCGSSYELTSELVPYFAVAMVPLGLLQGLGVFALASRRYPECFTLGGCSLGYLLLLYLVGRQPQLMPTYMFAGGLVVLMIVLFVGVVRWGRKQP